jgi:ParB/RepB/Spo0J family partition protein
MPPKKDFKSAMSSQVANFSGGFNGRSGPLGGNTLAETTVLELVKDQAAEIQQIKIGLLVDNPFQHLARPRLNDQAIEELADSIRENGFQGVLVARRHDSVYYELAYGHRRRAAAARAGLTTLPVQVVELTNEQMARIMAAENFAREDLSPLGEANVVGLLGTEQNLSAEKIGKIIGKSRAWVELRQRLYEAPEQVKQLVEQKPDSLTMVRSLTAIKDPGVLSQIIIEILEYGLTRDQLQGRINYLTANTIDAAARGEPVSWSTEATATPMQQFNKFADFLDKFGNKEKISEFLETASELPGVGPHDDVIEPEPPILPSQRTYTVTATGPYPNGFDPDKDDTRPPSEQIQNALSSIVKSVTNRLPKANSEIGNNRSDAAIKIYHQGQPVEEAGDDLVLEDVTPWDIGMSNLELGLEQLQKAGYENMPQSIKDRLEEHQKRYNVFMYPEFSNQPEPKKE